MRSRRTTYWLGVLDPCSTPLDTVQAPVWAVHGDNGLGSPGCRVKSSENNAAVPVAVGVLVGGTGVLVGVLVGVGGTEVLVDVLVGATAVKVAMTVLLPSMVMVCGLGLPARSPLQPAKASSRRPAWR